MKRKYLIILLSFIFVLLYNIGALYFCFYYLCAKGRDTHGKQHRRKLY